MVFYIWTKSKVIENLFSYISEFSGYAAFLPFVLFLLFVHKTHTERPLWIIFIYCAVCIAIDFIVAWLDVDGKSLHFVNSSLTAFEYLSFAAFIGFCIRKKQIRFILAAVSVGFIVFLAFYFMNASRKSRIDSIPIGIETLLILSFAFYLLFEMMNTIKDSFINYNYRFWVVIGIMVYLAGSFFIYLYANQLAPSEGRKFGVLLDFFYILKNIFFAVAILMAYRQPKPKTPPGSVPFLDMDTH